VVRETGGHWLKAIEVPGTAALNAGGNAQVTWVSCASAGNCAAGGSYQGRPGAQQALVGSPGNGHWRTAHTPRLRPRGPRDGNPGALAAAVRAGRLIGR